MSSYILKRRVSKLLHRKGDYEDHLKFSVEEAKAKRTIRWLILIELVIDTIGILCTL